MPTLIQPQKTKIDSKTKKKLKNFVQTSQIVDGTELKTCFDYYDFEDFNKIPITKQDFALPHMNISSTSAHIDNLKTFLKLFNTNFDSICISESRLPTKTSLTTNINILGYNIERIPTESTAGGTLMYISQKLSHKLRSDLKIYSPKELESTCVEIFISNKQNLTVGTI